MGDKLKQTVKGFALCYLMGAALFAAAGTNVAPCMTFPGAVYYGALWPLSPLSVALNKDLYPIPAWACEASKGEHSDGPR